MISMAAHAAPPGAITYLVIGSADPNKKLPLLDGVPNAGVSNIDMALPVRYLQHGYSYEVIIGGQNFAFTGTCVAAYTLISKANGGSQLIVSGSTEPFSCSATAVGQWPFPTPKIPNLRGPAVLSATLQFGKKMIKASIPLAIE